MPVTREARMALIYVATENNTDPKLFNASKVGAASAKAEAKMQKVVKKQINAASGFTTDKNESTKGYAIRLTVADIKIEAQSVKCNLSGYIEKLPRVVNKDGKEGEELASGKVSGNGKVSGTSEGDILFCIESVTEEMITKRCIPAMRADFINR